MAPRAGERSLDELFRSPPFTRAAAHKALFLRAMAACCRSQARRFAAVERLYRFEGFDPGRLRAERDLERVPFLFVNVFKELDFPARGAFRPALELTSSGTTGQKSRIRLDSGSLERVKLIAENVYRALGMVDKGLKTDHVCFTYDPRKARDLGTAFTDELLTSFTAPGEVFYAIRWDEASRGFGFDAQAVVEAVARLGCSGRPLRLLGFPAHLWFTLSEWRKRGLRDLRLGPKSWVMTGGGWKGSDGAAIPKERFRAEVARWLGIPESNVRDLYGLVEHGIPYVECRLGNMHVPNYSRVYVRDPGTLKVLPHGRQGLLQLLTPYLASFPSYSVLTGDWGLKRPSCACGVPGEVLVLLGRAGRSAARGCAAAAADLIGAGT